MANFVLKKLIRFVSIISVCLLIISGSDIRVLASDEKEYLEDQLEEIRIQIEENNKNLDSIYSEIADLNIKISQKEQVIEENQSNIELHKDEMAKRIRFMYESGSSMNIFTALLSADSFSDAINKISYIVKLTSYDREQFDEYADSVKELDEEMTELENRRSELIALRDSFESAQEEANAALKDAAARLAEFDIEESEAGEVIADYVNEHDNTSQDTSSSSNQEATAGDSIQNTENDINVSDDEKTQNKESKKEDVQHYVPIDTYDYTESDVYELARITYLEVGSSYPTVTYYAVYLTACVVLNRANNWYGGSITGAVYAPGQYSTAYKYTSWGGGELVINDITWSAVNDALSNCDPNPYYQGCYSSYLTEYYTDPNTGEKFYCAY